MHINHRRGETRTFVRRREGRYMSWDCSWMKKYAHKHERALVRDRLAKQIDPENWMHPHKYEVFDLWYYD